MYLYGASGHGKVIKDMIESQGDSVEGFEDGNPNLSLYRYKKEYHLADNLYPMIVSIGINTTGKANAESREPMSERSGHAA